MLHGIKCRKRHARIYFYPASKYELLLGSPLVRKSPASRKDPCFLLTTGKRSSQEKFSDRRMRNLRQVILPRTELRRRCPIDRMTASVLDLICGAGSVLGRRKICGRTSVVERVLFGRSRCEGSAPAPP